MEAELQAGDPSRIGPYRLVAVLGSGGMGRVYLGRSAAGREVAVKVIRSELATDQEFRARFRREVAAARLVNGLYTAGVVDADTEGPVPWLATAYIGGPSLADAVRRDGPLPPAALRALAAGLAEGLSAIHAAGVVHRDLKPSNVLLAADGPRVIDFGIAYASEASSLTGTSVVIGSPGYLSPEQAEPGRGIGPASDIFALGAVLCYAAAGRGPWGTGSVAAMVYRVVHGEPDLAGLPDEISSLVARCMAKLPGQRPTAADIVAELGDFEPVSGWFAGGGTGEASRPEQLAGTALTGSAPRIASSARSRPHTADAVALEDAIGWDTPPGTRPATPCLAAARRSRTTTLSRTAPTSGTASGAAGAAWRSWRLRSSLPPWWCRWSSRRRSRAREARGMRRPRACGPVLPPWLVSMPGLDTGSMSRTPSPPTAAMSGFSTAEMTP